MDKGEILKRGQTPGTEKEVTPRGNKGTLDRAWGGGNWWERREWEEMSGKGGEGGQLRGKGVHWDVAVREGVWGI